jgi:8-oxo-dGTP pyrophosphatase MutT (NUDIX family)
MFDAAAHRSRLFEILCGSGTTAAHIRSKLDGYTPETIKLGGLTPAAVAIIVMENQGGASILLTVRTDEVEHHKGEISFPGGRVDEGDKSPLAAALRETHEEIGLDPERLELLGRLDDVISISSYLVTPYVFHLEGKPPALTPQPTEVSEIITVPLTHLLQPTNHRLDYSYGPGRPLHFFQWEGKDIWGLTGGVLYQLLQVAFNFKG